ncbi:hypothetical protein LOAG_15915, partial [Loa loa]
MHTVPIINENIRSHGKFINRLMSNEFYNSKWILTRRLYFVDSISLDATNDAQNLGIIRFLEKIDIKIQIQSQKDGHIMPPHVRIRYTEIERNPEKQISLQFNITYFMKDSQFMHYIESALFIL